MEPIPEQVLELVSKVMQPTSLEETLENFKTIGPSNVRSWWPCMVPNNAWHKAVRQNKKACFRLGIAG